MSKYIDAEKLIAEIDRRIKYQLTCIENEYRLSGKAEEEIIFEYNSLSNFINSLQQERPGVNLEKEIEKYYYDRFAFISSAHNPTLNILTDIANYFYELGINARKEK